MTAKYPGKLGKRAPTKLRPPPPSLFWLLDTKPAKQDRDAAQWRHVLASMSHEMEGVKLLREHYNIKERGSSGLLELVLHLARDNVPYFQPRAAKTKRWDLVAHAQLILDVWDEQAKARKGRKPITVPGACEKLRSRPLYRRNAAGSLEARYKDALGESVIQVLQYFVPDKSQLAEGLRMLANRKGTK